jgi:hypothetical protein
VRSFEPIEKIGIELVSGNCGCGTSTMMPRLARRAGTPAESSKATSSPSMARAVMSSRGNVTIGSMIFIAVHAARRRAAARKTSAALKDRRTPRTPRKGLLSPSEREVGDRLVATGIERPNGHRSVPRPFDDTAVDRVLLLFVGEFARSWNRNSVRTSPIPVADGGSRPFNSAGSAMFSMMRIGVPSNVTAGRSAAVSPVRSSDDRLASSSTGARGQAD